MTIMELTTNPSATVTRSPHPKSAIAAAIVILLGSLLLIFANLGHYPLWDDEAITAMTARSVWRTGDTSAWVDDHNLMAYRNGLLINHFADRYEPPLQFYFAAPFMGLFGESPFICRLPFAICGILTIILILRWLWRANPHPVIWWGAAFVILTNAEFFLFTRNCRYYSLATLFTALAIYLYYNWNSHRKSIWPFSIAMAVLLSAQYLNYAALVGALMVDYGIWGRKRRIILRREWLIVIIPQLLVGAVVCSIWNPIARAAEAVATITATTPDGKTITSTPPPIDPSHTTLIHDILHLYWWTWRDMLACDFIIVPLLLICPFLYLKRKNNWMLRAPFSLFIYLGVIAVFTAHSVNNVGNAEIRYLAPILPLCMAISILAIWGLSAMKPAVFVTAMIVAIGTMLVEPDATTGAPKFSSVTLLFYHELISPQAEPYTPLLAWMKSNIKPGKSVFVQPDWMTYPIMFLDSDPTYAWQLSFPAKPEYAKLPDIFFRNRVAPDYLISFGPFEKEMSESRSLLAQRNIFYKQIATIHTYWSALYRPERNWRSFVTIIPKPGEEVYIFQRIVN